jgi:hypothetical protein
VSDVPFLAMPIMQFKCHNDRGALQAAKLKAAADHDTAKAAAKARRVRVTSLTFVVGVLGQTVRVQSADLRALAKF